MEKITAPQLACIGALITKLRLQAQKTDMVLGFSGGRCDSSKDLFKTEATELIKHLKSLDPEEKSNELMRRKVISMAHELGYRMPGTTKVDMQKLDAWIVKYGQHHKKINQHNHNELVDLVSQFEERYKRDLKRL